MKLREFDIGNYSLWIDRVPAMHGTVRIVTLWLRHDDGRWQRLFGGLMLHQALEAVGRMKAPQS